MRACVCVCACLLRLSCSATQHDIYPPSNTYTETHTYTSATPTQCYVLQSKRAFIFGQFFCSHCVAFRYVSIRFDSIYAAFSMQNFHTLALINPQTAALVNMQAPKHMPAISLCTHTQRHTHTQRLGDSLMSRSAIENHCALVNDTFVDQRVRQRQPPGRQASTAPCHAPSPPRCLASN